MLFELQIRYLEESVTALVKQGKRARELHSNGATARAHG